MPFRGSITGSGYGRWQNGAAYYNTVGRAQWATEITTTVATNTSNLGKLFGGVCDSSNNLYVCGSFDMGNARIVLYDASRNTQAISQYSNATVTGTWPRPTIAKYDSSGRAQWIACMGPGGNTVIASDIAIDSSRNLYICGFTYIPTTNGFCNASGFVTATSPILFIPGANRSAFFAKLNTNGQFQWATYLPGNTNVNTTDGYRCAVDTANNVYFAGVYTTTGIDPIILKDASGTTQRDASYSLPQTNGAVWQYLIKYDANGAIDWSVYSKTSRFDTSGASFDGTLGGVATDNDNNVYMGITYSDSNYIIDASGFSQSNSALAQISTVAYGFGAALIKYNSDGKAQWCVSIDPGYGCESRSIVVDSKSNIYWVGTYRTNADSSPILIRDASGYNQVNTAFTLRNPTSVNNTATFMIKYNPNGKTQWVTCFEQLNGNAFGYKASVDSLNNIYIPGSVTQSGTRINMYNAFGNTQVLALPGFTSASIAGETGILLKYNSNGIAQWGTYYSANTSDFCFAAPVDRQNSVYAVGLSQTTAAGGITSIFNVVGNDVAISPFTITPRVNAAQYGAIIKYR